MTSAPSRPKISRSNGSSSSPGSSRSPRISRRIAVPNSGLPKPPHEHLETRPVALRAARRVHQREQLQAQRQLAGIIVDCPSTRPPDPASGRGFLTARCKRRPSQPWSTSGNALRSMSRIKSASSGLSSPSKRGECREGIDQHPDLGVRTGPQRAQPAHPGNRPQPAHHTRPSNDRPCAADDGSLAGGQ